MPSITRKYLLKIEVFLIYLGFKSEKVLLNLNTLENNHTAFRTKNGFEQRCFMTKYYNIRKHNTMW